MNNNQILSSWIPSVITNTIWAGIIFYAFYLYFIKYFEKGQFVKYLLISLVVSFIITFIFISFHAIFIIDFNPFSFRTLGINSFGSVIIAQSGCLIRGFENWVDNIKLQAELETRNARNELEILKSQINPHFLFNTLHNIDSLIHKNQAEASEALLELSDMLNYMIYETNTDKVLLSKELIYLKHYINLQKLRFRKTNFVKANLPNTCDNEIAPMLLIPFIENAFKYVAKEKNTGVEIVLKCIDNNLTFTCSNSFNDCNTTKIHTGGLGLENVKRRLELIYPKKHTLHISKENYIYRVELNLILD